jgi:hypothetical protein
VTRAVPFSTCKSLKQINDKPEFAEFLNDLLFDRYAERKQAAAPDRDDASPAI